MLIMVVQWGGWVEKTIQPLYGKGWPIGLENPIDFGLG